MVDLVLFNNLVWIIILLLFLLFIKGAELAYLAKRFLLHVEELGFLALVLILLDLHSFLQFDIKINFNILEFWIWKSYYIKKKKNITYII